MNEMFGCFLNPGGCFNDGISAFIAWFPFGIEGIKAAAWMIVGAALGRFGVAAVIALALALKAAGKKESDIFEHEDPKPVPIPKPKKPSIFKRH